MKIASPPLRLMLIIAAAVLTVSQMGCYSAKRAAEMENAAAARSTLVGRVAPDFTLPDQDGKPVHLADDRGKWVVLYFYPKDGTPGCTCQAFEFSKVHSQFAKLNAKVFGISADSPESHRHVIDKFGFQVPLLADPELKVMRAYGAWLDYSWGGGRPVRSTVLIDPAGNIAHHWPEVIPEGHAERVRQKLEELRGVAKSAAPVE